MDVPAIGVCVSMAKQQCEKVADSLYVTLSCYYHQGCKTTTTATITSKKVLPCSGLYKVKSPFAVGYERCEHLTKNIQVIKYLTYYQQIERIEEL